MRFKFLIIPTVCMMQIAAAQSGSTTVTPAPVTNTNSAISTTSAAVAQTEPDFIPAAATSTLTRIMDYNSVYDASTLEEEMKLATERFSLTPSQQEIWSVAAKDRRAAEKTARAQMDTTKGTYERGALYKGVKSAHSSFYETIIGYLTPAQKQAMEIDRQILEEKRKRLAKIPPPPSAPTVTVVPVDSAAIKAAEKEKATSKKSKKKKKPAGA